MYLIPLASPIYALTNRHKRYTRVWALVASEEIRKIQQPLRALAADPRLIPVTVWKKANVITFQLGPNKCQKRSLDFLPYNTEPASRAVAFTSRSIKACSRVQFPWEITHAQ